VLGSSDIGWVLNDFENGFPENEKMIPKIIS
jgi:hypothetical protein